MPEFHDHELFGEIEATKATARLPGLDIEIMHRRSPSEDAEQLSINLRAIPSFEAFGYLIGSLNPFLVWTRAIETVWFPWLSTAQRSFPLALMFRRLSEAGSSSPADGHDQLK